MLNNIIGSLYLSMVSISNWSYLLDKKINFKNYKLYVGLILMVILLIINFFSINTIIKCLLVILIFALAIIYIYNEKVKQGIVLAAITQLMFIICEVLVIIAVLIITNIQNRTELVETFFGTIYANIIISTLVLIVGHLPFVKNIYKKIVYLTREEKVGNTIIVIFGIGATASLLFNLIYYTNNLILVSFIGVALLIIFLMFVMKGIVMRNNYLKMYVKYNSTLETLKSYEDVLDKYKVANHENKNQLLMIRNMLGKDTKNDVGKYIDKIVKNEYEDDENLIMETTKIPSGGLRALIYSKILYMKNNNIKFDLKVDRKIRNIQLTDLDQNIILDICKVVGVFLDNAIEETTKIKNGSINIELYILDNIFNVSIANIFEGSIDLDKMDEIKYTTKGEGHGYGLTLVKEIVNRNSQLENVRMINDNVFIQILKINI